MTKFVSEKPRVMIMVAGRFLVRSPLCAYDIWNNTSDSILPGRFSVSIVGFRDCVFFSVQY